MGTNVPDYPDIDAATVENVRVEDEMEQSYIDYAMSVIAGRALPDVRDGLKPVHRRILYAMEYEGVTSNSGHRKSSSIVGATMGNWHPHGDSAIYDTLVRMAQDFSMRYPLVDGQGNFGSIDGDPPAAMRYTEARMAPLAEEMLADIDKDTVDWQASYDGRIDEPAVLPAAFPNLLCNGSSGIAVGMSTNVPPHNLGEIVDAAVALIEDPDVSVPDLMEHVKGPDFPTGGQIVGRQAIRSAYQTGRGRLTVRGVTEVDEEDGRIVVTEIPFQVDKSKLIEKAADLVNEGTIEGIRDIRDESDREGVRIVFELKRDALADVVENQLLQHTRLEKTFGVINLALVDGQPRVLDLKEMLRHYLDHRREVVRRRSEYELDEAEERAHVLEGRLVAVDNAEDVVEIVQDSEDREAAKEALKDEYDFSERQADHVVRMQIGSLTSMEVGEIGAEYDDLQDEIERLEAILASDEALMEVVKDELLEIEEEYDDDRRTVIVEGEGGEVTDEDLIPERDVLVVMTRDGYAKRMDLDDFDPQNRGGKGIIGCDVKEGDAVSKAFVANSHEYVLCFTNHGQVYRLKTYEIPEMSRTARGRSAVNLLDLDEGEEISAVVNTEDFDPDECVLMVTRNGMVNRTSADEFENILSTGINAIRLEDGDELVDVEVTDGGNDVVIGTAEGNAIRFDESEVTETGRNTKGVGGVKLRDGDRVAGLAVARDDGRDLLTVTADGYGKRTPLAEYSKQSRYGYGNIDIDTGATDGHAVAIDAVDPDDHVIVFSDDGQIMRTRIDEISRQGRNTKGVIVMRLEEGDAVATVTPVAAETATVDEDDAAAEADAAPADDT